MYVLLQWWPVEDAQRNKTRNNSQYVRNIRNNSQYVVILSTGEGWRSLLGNTWTKFSFIESHLIVIKWSIKHLLFKLNYQYVPILSFICGLDSITISAEYHKLIMFKKITSFGLFQNHGLIISLGPSKSVLGKAVNDCFLCMFSVQMLNVSNIYRSLS